MSSSPAFPVAWPQRLLVSFFLVTTAAIILYTMVAAFHYSSNAMLGRDEANFILLSSQKMLRATTPHDFLSALFPNHGQHMLFGMQLVNLLTFFTFGSLDRRIMNVIGVIILCAAALVVPGKRRRSAAEMILLYATLFPLVLSPAHNACIVNASCTGNHYFGIAFSVFSLYFFSRCHERLFFLVCAEITLFLATFSLSTAIAMIPVSYLVLWRNPSPQRQHVLAFHTVFIVLLMALQLYLTYPDTIFSFAQEVDAATIADALKRLALSGATVLIILASLFYWLNDIGYTWALTLLGLGVLVMLMIFFFQLRGKDKSLFHYDGVILFCLMCVLIGFGRYYSLGSSRYAAYTGFLFAFLFCGWFYHAHREDSAGLPRRLRWLTVSATTSLLYYFLALHYHQPYLLALEQKNELCKKLWINEGYVCGVMITHEEATRIVRSAIDQGVYRIEK
jgi:hypothetical protein